MATKGRGIKIPKRRPPGPKRVLSILDSPEHQAALAAIRKAGWPDSDPLTDKKTP